MFQNFSDVPRNDIAVGDWNIQCRMSERGITVFGYFTKYYNWFLQLRVAIRIRHRGRTKCLIGSNFGGEKIRWIWPKLIRQFRFSLFRHIHQLKFPLNLFFWLYEPLKLFFCFFSTPILRLKSFATTKSTFFRYHVLRKMFF